MVPVSHLISGVHIVSLYDRSDQLLSQTFLKNYELFYLDRTEYLLYSKFTKTTPPQSPADNIYALTAKRASQFLQEISRRSHHK